LIVFRFRNELIRFSVEDSDPYEQVAVKHNYYVVGFTTCSLERFLKIANKNYLLSPLLEAIISQDVKNMERVIKEINFFLDISAAKKCEMIRYKITKIKDRLILFWQMLRNHKYL